MQDMYFYMWEFERGTPAFTGFLRRFLNQVVKWFVAYRKYTLLFYLIQQFCYEGKKSYSTSVCRKWQYEDGNVDK